MLAQLLIDELVVCVLLLLAGWLGDEIRAGWWGHGSARATSCTWTGRPQHIWPFEDPDATWTELPCKN